MQVAISGLEARSDPPGGVSLGNAVGWWPVSRDESRFRECCVADAVRRWFLPPVGLLFRRGCGTAWRMLDLCKEFFDRAARNCTCNVWAWESGWIVSSSCKAGRSRMSIDEIRSSWGVDPLLTEGSGDGVARGMSEREVRVRGGSAALTERDSSSSKIAGFIAIDLGEYFEWSAWTAQEGGIRLGRNTIRGVGAHRMGGG